LTISLPNGPPPSGGKAPQKITRPRSGVFL